MKILMLCSLSCYFLCLRSEYFPEPFDAKYLQSVVDCSGGGYILLCTCFYTVSYF